MFREKRGDALEQISVVANSGTMLLRLKHPNQRNKKKNNKTTHQYIIYIYITHYVQKN